MGKKKIETLCKVSIFLIVDKISNVPILLKGSKKGAKGQILYKYFMFMIREGGMRNKYLLVT